MRKVAVAGLNPLTGTTTERLAGKTPLVGTFGDSFSLKKHVVTVSLRDVSPLENDGDVVVA